MQDKLNLSWEKFSEHQVLFLKYIYQEGQYSDVTLVSDDQTQFKAHKIVLIACSPVFKKIIDNNPSQHPLIYLRGIQSYELASILQFIYLGEAKCFRERMGEFLQVAKDLEVEGISDGVKSQKEKETIEDNKEDVTIGEENPDYCPELDSVYFDESSIMKHDRSRHADIRSEHQATQPKPQWLPMRKRGSRRAPVWSCADPTEDGGAECKFCGKYYPIPQGSTSNLHRHLENHHSEEDLVKKIIKEKLIKRKFFESFSC